MSNKRKERGSPAVIPLEDLAPQKDPKGGSGKSGKAVFGGGVPVSNGRDPRKPGGTERGGKKRS